MSLPSIPAIREAAEAPASDALPLWTANGLGVELEEVPVAAQAEFTRACVELCSSGCRLAALLELPETSGTPSRLLAAIADNPGGRIGLLRCELTTRAYPSLTLALPQAQAFERELFELHGTLPEGHPWLKALRFHAELEPRTGLPPHPFFKLDGPGVHEVAVGPVHAGIIEPGHFRFQCHGEVVDHLEIQLGYQHRGVEASLLDARPARRAILAESIAGDTAVGHALAYAVANEALAGVEAPLHAESIRGIALELERLANHIGDLGALSNDVGYVPGASWFGRLRGEYLNLLLELTGNRFGRGLVRPGGVRFTLTSAQRSDFLSRLARAERDLGDIAGTLFESPSVCSRFENTGVLEKAHAEALGLVGPAARASGCDLDVRRDHSTGIYRFAHIPVARADSGDVMARAVVRWLEAQRSSAFVREQLSELSAPALSVEVPQPRSGRLAVALVEGWRGEIVHVALSAEQGELTTYKIVDPSFKNWFGLAFALRANQISDFPLCNKSFNLSYAGHDL